MAKKRAKAMTRDTMISMLRTRGVKGRLSKMTKPQLRKLLDGTAPPGAPGSALSSAAASSRSTSNGATKNRNGSRIKCVQGTRVRNDPGRSGARAVRGGGRDVSA